MDELNTYFANVDSNTFMRRLQSVTDLNETLHNISPTYSLDLFRSHPIDANTVILVIIHLKYTNSYGYDSIPLRFLKDDLSVITPYLTCILNTSIVTGIFFTTWKRSCNSYIQK